MEPNSNFLCTLFDSDAQVTETAVCNVLSVDNICSALGGLGRLKRKSSAISTNLDTDVTLDVLSRVKKIGHGTFGEVFLVIHKRNNNRYALKIQNMHEIIERGQTGAVIREKNLMASIDHPFICKLINCFHDENHLFMVMELAQGGDLFSIIHTNQSDGVPEDSARFYAANVLDGLMRKFLFMCGCLLKF